MSERAHTKGPWRVAKTTFGQTVIDAESVGEIVCRIEEWTPEQDAADARLIAAAPDMFEALQCLPIGWLSAGILSHSDSDILMIKMQVTGTVYEHEISVGQLRAAATALSKASGKVDHG